MTPPGPPAGGDLVLAETPDLVIVQPSEVGRPTPEEAQAQPGDPCAVCPSTCRASKRGRASWTGTGSAVSSPALSAATAVRTGNANRRRRALSTHRVVTPVVAVGRWAAASLRRALATVVEGWQETREQRTAALGSPLGSRRRGVDPPRRPRQNPRSVKRKMNNVPLKRLPSAARSAAAPASMRVLDQEGRVGIAPDARTSRNARATW